MPTDPGRPNLDFRRLFEAVPGLFLVLRPDLTIVAVSDEYLRATMTVREEILGRGLFEVFPDNPDDPTATGVGNLRASLARVLVTRASDTMAIQKYDVRRPASEGGAFEERYWSPINAPLLGKDCQVEFIIHRVEDVTEFVRLRQREREREQLAAGLRSRTSQLEAEVYVRAQQVQAASRQVEAAHAALERARAELEERVEQRTAELLQANQALQAEVSVREQAQAQLLESNRQLEIALADVSQAQTALVRQERLRALGELASGITHDFNNALGMIVGFAELLLADPNAMSEPEEALAKVRLIHSAAMDAGSVVARLREFYRPRSDHEELHPIQLNDVIAQAVSLTQPRWRDQAHLSGRDIQVILDLHQIPLVDAIAAELREVVANLILNAVDAMPAGGTLTVHSHAEDEHAIVKVADSGTGMAPEVRDRIFEPFFTTKGESGTGLGLAVVHGIITRHGGQIEVTSEEGQGTTFTIRLPISTSGDVQAPASADVISSRGLRVLLAEDEPALRRILVSYLQIDSHTVIAAPDGREALAAFRANTSAEADTFDLVITDRAMPDINGDQLAAEITRLSPETPVLMLTGLGELMNDTDERPFGVDFVVGKPVGLADLRRSIAALLSPE